LRNLRPGQLASTAPLTSPPAGRPLTSYGGSRLRALHLPDRFHRHL